MKSPLKTKLCLYDQLTVRALQLVYKTIAALGHGAGCLTAQTQTRTLHAVWCLQTIKSALTRDLHALDIGPWL